MSSAYVLGPPTKGKVTVKTTYGPLDIELWPKEAPKAVRNFVQLCLEGYYDNTIFHRIIKSFLVQGGDPTCTGRGAESIYGAPFAVEYHSHLRRLIYNLLRFGEVETDKDDRPLDPPKLLSVEVLWNPFDDIVPRVLPGKLQLQPAAEAENKDQKKKAVKKLNLLSFGEEAEEEEKELAAVKKKIGSSHDVLNDPCLLKGETTNKELIPVKPIACIRPAEIQKTKDIQLSVREALSFRKKEPRNESRAFPSENLDLSDDDEASFDAWMRQQIIKKRKELGDLPSKKNSYKDSKSRDEDKLSPRTLKVIFLIFQLLSGHIGFAYSLSWFIEVAVHMLLQDIITLSYDRPKVDTLSIKKNGIGSEARAERLADSDADLQLLNAAERERQLQKLKKRKLQGRGDDDRMSCKEDVNDNVVHDPLLENGKEKFNRQIAKQKRREREWAGKSLT
ncbi:Cyclophilin-type peptidyl-prolyl cis-trans isomerase domain [Dillenia turbinata]|uniref:Cyclophilin-type peptidyl-prolyl cis-trans isomerase domain n=1 Tax=Dillenia turbinata TaxID=194707 RepID=A0AAN8ZB88_9MAGN